MRKPIPASILCIASTASITIIQSWVKNIANAKDSEVYIEMILGFLHHKDNLFLTYSKVVEAYKRDKSIKPSLREQGAIQYDQQNPK
jgi:hypothetical protein